MATGQVATGLVYHLFTNSSAVMALLELEKDSCAVTDTPFLLSLRDPQEFTSLHGFGLLRVPHIGKSACAVLCVARGDKALAGCFVLFQVCMAQSTLSALPWRCCLFQLYPGKCTWQLSVINSREKSGSFRSKYSG